VFFFWCQNGKKNKKNKKMQICSNSKFQLNNAGVTAIQRCPCEFTDRSGNTVICDRPFADHREENYGL
jgi:hypothetical protein